MRSILILLVFSSEAFGQRVVFPVFTGPKASVVRKQLTDQMCESLECVPIAKATKRGKPDFKAAKKERVSYFILGRVVKTRKQTDVELVIQNAQGKVISKKKFPLVKSALTLKGLSDSTDFLGQKLLRPKVALTKPAAEETPSAPPMVNQKLSPEATPTPLRRPSKSVTMPEQAPLVSEETNDVAPAKVTEQKKRTPVVLVADLNVELTNRKFDYVEAQSAQLKRYDLALFASPALNVQFYPLALIQNDALAGLGVEFGLSIAPYLRSKPSVTESYPTTASRVDVNVTFRMMPFEFPLEIRPFLGFRSQAFVISPVNDVSISDLPNLIFTGITFGTHLEMAIEPEVFSLFGHIALNPVFSSAEIISPNYFSQGTNFGFEFGAGVGVWVLPVLQIRAAFHFNSYSLRFSARPEDTYVAEGAYDRYMSGVLGLRLTL